ncbi:hypothetical protein J6590_034266 [Homalodisca vitripennis]|nr:hypothetical protein J6590_034266 [Homalodisca vitripennis]
MDNEELNAESVNAEEGGMEADANQDFQDYWNEIRIIQETKRLDEFLDEEYGGRDDGHLNQSCSVPYVIAMRYLSCNSVRLTCVLVVNGIEHFLYDAFLKCAAKSLGVACIGLGVAYVEIKLHAEVQVISSFSKYRSDRHTEMKYFQTLEWVGFVNAQPINTH